MHKFAWAMDSYLQKIGLHEQLKQKKWLQKWPEVVGRYICRYAQPLVLKKGVLWVEVSDSNWLYHLTTMKEKILADYNKIIGLSIVKEIKLINAGVMKRTREIQSFSGAENNFVRLEQKRINIVLDQNEKNNIEGYVELIPAPYRDSFRNIINYFYLQQKIKFEEGALLCQVCGIPCYEEEMKEGLCLFCFRESEEWIQSLQTIFYKSPWITLDALRSNYSFFLDEKLFRFCKEKIRKKCFEKIMKLAAEEGLYSEEQKNLCKRLLLRYIVFVSEKEPPLIQPEDEFRALRDFGGLFKNLRLVDIEHNNVYGLTDEMGPTGEMSEQ